MPDLLEPSRSYRPRLARLVTHLRDQAGLTQEELAKAIGTDQSVISRIETGETRRPRLQTQLAIAEALQAAGLDFDAEAFMMASSLVDPADVGDLDERLLRVHDRLQSYPPHLQDAFYDALDSLLQVLELSARTPPDEG